MESPMSTALRPDSYDFLDRIRCPAAADSLHQKLPHVLFPRPQCRGGEDGGKVFPRGDGERHQGPSALGQRHQPGDQPHAQGPGEVSHNQIVRPHVWDLH